jgi:hypothetical protein
LAQSEGPRDADGEWICICGNIAVRTFGIGLLLERKKM